METNWAAEHLQVIRTLMERSAVYRRALAPIMIYTGVLGVAGGVGGLIFRINSPRGFVGYWAGVAVAALVGAFLLVRRQALKEAEPFWSPPTRRVAQGLLPPLCAGSVAGLLALIFPGWHLVPVESLPVLWLVLYGCALNAAGFFMHRGIKLLGWIFVVFGCGLMVASTQSSPGSLAPLAVAHWVMGAAFGGLHLAYGVYLYFTEQRRNET